MKTDNESKGDQFEALQRRVEQLEARLAVQPARARTGRGLRLGAAVVLVLVGGGTVFAANGDCPNGLPFCFAPDTPALASQVNTNFMQLKEWLEAKVGGVGSGGVQATSVTAGSLSVANGGSVGSLRVNSGGVVGAASGNLYLDASNGTTYLNWNSGTGGVVIGNGLQANVASVDWGGSMNLAGHLSISGVGGNTPHGCVVRQAPPSSYNAACSAGEIAVGGGGRCAYLWRLTESLPWGGPSDADSPVVGAAPVAWRSVCQIWGDNGTYAAPQLGAFAVCCRY